MIKINDFSSINACHSVVWITIYVPIQCSILRTSRFDLSTAVKTKLQTVKTVRTIGIKIIDGIGLFRASMLENRTVLPHIIDCKQYSTMINNNNN